MKHTYTIIIVWNDVSCIENSWLLSNSSLCSVLNLKPVEEHTAFHLSVSLTARGEFLRHKLFIAHNKLINLWSYTKACTLNVRDCWRLVDILHTGMFIMWTFKVATLWLFAVHFLQRKENLSRDVVLIFNQRNFIK